MTMAQQFHNGGHHDGSVTISIRDSLGYAVINPPFEGAHTKPQTDKYRKRRKALWRRRNKELNK